MYLTDLVSAAAGSLTRAAAVAGGEWAGACPKCGGTDRFRVWPAHPKGTGGRFLCRQCGWQGDGLQFLMDTEGLSYPEACRHLGTAPKSRRSLSIQVREEWRPKLVALPGGSWTLAAEKFVAYAEAHMERCGPGHAYAASRGLTDQTVAALRIGWNPGTLYHDRVAWGLGSDVSEMTGKPRRVWLPAGLVIPTMNNGKIVSVKIRRAEWKPEDSLPKYAAATGSATAPMILAPGTGKPVVVVESELDAILCAQAARDLVCAVALRTAKAKPDDGSHALLQAAPVILVATDADEAGATAWPWWRTTYPKAKRWPVLSGKDVGDLAATPGLIRAWIEAGLPEPTEAVEPEPRPETSPPAGKPSLRRAADLAHGEPCPYDAYALAQFHERSPHLRCCPKTTPQWWFVETSWCDTRCTSPCELQPNQ